jgi:hypothetical protein
MDDHLFSAETASAPAKPWNWRWWMMWGCVGAMFLLIAWLRTTDYTGVESTKEGERLVYRMSPWAMAPFAGPILVGLLLAFALVTLPSKLVRLLAAIPFLAAVAVLVALPTVLTARLVVSPEGFEHTAGFWWEPVTKTVRFAELDSITFKPIEREGQKPTFKLVCRAKNGDEFEIQKSTLLEAGLLNIFGKAMRAGVAVEGWGDVEGEELGTEIGT